MKKMANKNILDIKPYVPGKPIEEVKRELGIKKVIKLASNESPFGPSPKVLRAIEKASLSANRYPDGDCFYLRQELAKRLKVHPRELIFGNGSDEIIVLAVRAFVNSGDEAVMAKPSFLIYDIASRIAGARVKAIPLKNFRYDLSEMKRAVTQKTKIVFLGNPDNPSGMYIPKDAMVGFIQSIRKDILVFIDEAYFEYVRAKDYGYSIDLLKTYKNVIVTRTFSKMYGLAALRIGYGIASLETIDILNRIREPFNVNSLAQAAALACLRDKSYYSRLADVVEQQRQFLYGRFKQIGLVSVESCANFILIDVKQEAAKIVKAMMRKGVIVRDMGLWGLSRFIRVTIGSAQENRQLIKTLEEVL